MPDLTKIATCSYCGTRSVLRLAGKVRHELACGACGARLHTLKPLRSDFPRRSAPEPVSQKPRTPPRPGRRRKTDHRFRSILEMIEEVWDEIEDIFD